MPFSRAGFHPAQRQAQQCPDVLSLLVETGFISNVRDSQRSVNAHHQQAVAYGLFEGL
jgi:N-acetylmuramoyl-L-alanine amidase